MIQHEKRVEFEQNFRAFTQVLPTLLPTYEGKYALMRHEKVIACFNTPGEALKSGRSQFSDGLFSVQTVTTSQADFGWYSRVPDSRSL